MKRKTMLFFMLLPFFGSCLSQQKEDVVIEQIESKHSIIIGGYFEGYKFFWIDFILAYKIKKNIPDELFLECSSYIYEGECESRRGYTMAICPSLPSKIPLGWKEGDRLDYSYKEFVYRVSHQPDTSKRTQMLLQPYVDKMLSLGKDTLHIGTIEQLKKTDPELLKGFLGGDSIRIDYRNRDKRRTHRIFLPVEIK